MQYFNWYKRAATEAAIQAQKDAKVWKAGTKFLAKCREREDRWSEVERRPMIRRGDGSYTGGQLIDEETAEQYGISIRSWI